MTPHTPGPWKLGNAYDCAPGHAVCSGPAVVARVVGLGYPIGLGRAPESAANARLIAAAPDLLAALEKLRAELREVVKFDVKKHYSLMVADVAADKAARKARGET